jgi:hypothetical protein
MYLLDAGDRDSAWEEYEIRKELTEDLSSELLHLT